MEKLIELLNESAVLDTIFENNLCAVLIGTFIAMNSSISLMEKSNDTLLQRVWELQRVDRQKCADLLLNGEI